MDKGYSEVFAVLGMARLEAGPALVVVTGVEEVRAATISREEREQRQGRADSGRRATSTPDRPITAAGPRACLPAR